MIHDPHDSLTLFHHEKNYAKTNTTEIALQIRDDARLQDCEACGAALPWCKAVMQYGEKELKRLAVVAVLSAACFADAEEIDLAGTWTLTQVESNTVTCPVAVPGGIYTALYEAKYIPDPYWAQNEKLTQWPSRAEWDFARTFDVPAAFAATIFYFQMINHFPRMKNVCVFFCQPQMIHSLFISRAPFRGSVVHAPYRFMEHQRAFREQIQVFLQVVLKIRQIEHHQQLKSEGGSESFTVDPGCFQLRTGQHAGIDINIQMRSLSFRPV